MGARVGVRAGRIVFSPHAATASLAEAKAYQAELQAAVQTLESLESIRMILCLQGRDFVRKLNAISFRPEVALPLALAIMEEMPESAERIATKLFPSRNLPSLLLSGHLLPPEIRPQIVPALCELPVAPLTKPKGLRPFLDLVMTVAHDDEARHQLETYLHGGFANGITLLDVLVNLPAESRADMKILGHGLEQVAPRCTLAPLSSAYEELLGHFIAMMPVEDLEATLPLLRAGPTEVFTDTRAWLERRVSERLALEHVSRGVAPAEAMMAP